MLQLEAEGKLSLDDKLSKFFPNDFPKWQNVTIKQMLNMTSGIPEYTSILIETYRNNPKRNFSTDEILNVVKDKDLSFSPGSHFFYSNTNYLHANKIIEEIPEKNQYYGMDIIDLSMSLTNGGGSITATSNDLNLFIRN